MQPIHKNLFSLRIHIKNQQNEQKFKLSDDCCYKIGCYLNLFRTKNAWCVWYNPNF